MVARKEVAYFCHLMCDLPVLTTLGTLEINEVLDQFESTFRELTSLPPSRSTDHHITLVAGAQPVNVNPYWYPHFQKKGNREDDEEDRFVSRLPSDPHQGR